MNTEDLSIFFILKIYGKVNQMLILKYNLKANFPLGNTLLQPLLPLFEIKKSFFSLRQSPVTIITSLNIFFLTDHDTQRGVNTVQ